MDLAIASLFQITISKNFESQIFFVSRVTDVKRNSQEQFDYFNLLSFNHIAKMPIYHKRQDHI